MLSQRKYQRALFLEYNKLILKFIWKNKYPRITRNFLKKKETRGSKPQRVLKCTVKATTFTWVEPRSRQAVQLNFIERAQKYTQMFLKICYEIKMPFPTNREKVFNKLLGQPGVALVNSPCYPHT